MPSAIISAADLLVRSDSGGDRDHISDSPVAAKAEQVQNAARSPFSVASSDDLPADKAALSTLSLI